MSEIKFTACKNLEFDQPKYSAQLDLINSGGTTKGVWERRDPDGNLQLCQFCKLDGRHNGPECCLDSLNAECGDYEDYEHTILLADEDPGKADGEKPAGKKPAKAKAKK